MNALSHELSMNEPFVKNSLFEKKGLVVIDDDEQFCNLVRLVGQNMGIPVVCHESLYDLGSFACLREFDLAILDYRLESINGIEIAEYVDTFFNHLPVLLVSADAELANSRNLWPKSIKNFICKSRGPFSILNAACQIVERDRFLRQFAGSDGRN